MAHEIRTITDSIHVSSYRGTVHIGASMHARLSEDYVTTTIIVAPAVARAIAAALVEMADDAEANAKADFEPETAPA